MTGKAEKVGAALGKSVGVILTVVLTGLIVGTIIAAPVMLMWDFVMPDLFGVPEITFWQAFWGVLMSRMLFTSNAISKE